MPRKDPGRSQAPMDPQRLRAIRRRLSEGYYDRPEVGLEMARRILASGDL